MQLYALPIGCQQPSVDGIQRLHLILPNEAHPEAIDVLRSHRLLAEGPASWNVHRIMWAALAVVQLGRITIVAITRCEFLQCLGRGALECLGKSYSEGRVGMQGLSSGSQGRVYRERGGNWVQGYFKGNANIYLKST